MHYGIYVPNFGLFGDAGRLATLADDAEASGWDGFFIWDHIAGDVGPEPFVDPWVALAAIALNTRRIRIGTTVTPLPRRRPHKVARETVSIDHLSGGRLVFGVGTGLGTEEWDDLGEEADTRIRGAMLDEGLDVLTGLWSGEPFSYDGQHYSIKKTHFLPGPVQQPRIPIWVGGFWPNKVPMRRAARWDGVFPLFGMEGQTDITLFRDMVAYVRDQRGDRPGPFDIIHMGVTSGDDRGDDIAPFAEAGATWWLELLTPWIYGGLAAMRKRIQQGPPAP